MKFLTILCHFTESTTDCLLHKDTSYIQCTLCSSKLGETLKCSDKCQLQKYYHFFKEYKLQENEGMKSVSFQIPPHSFHTTLSSLCLVHFVSTFLEVFIELNLVTECFSYWLSLSSYCSNIMNKMAILSSSESPMRPNTTRKLKNFFPYFSPQIQLAIE